MVLNPIMMIVFAGVSLMGGVVGLSQTDSLWSVVPFAVFIFLFCLSLFIPEVTKAQLVASGRVALKAIKLSAEWLSALGHYGARYLAQKRFEMGRARRAKPIASSYQAR